MWQGWVAAVRLGRFIWVQEVQPELVAGGWLLVLNCMAVSYQSYVTHLLVLPSHILGGYLKNLLLYSGLVLSMQRIALIRVGLVSVGMAFFNWSSVRGGSQLLALCAHISVLLGLFVIRYSSSRYHPLRYGHWRWRMILALNITTTSLHGQVTHLFTSPCHTLGGYFRCLFL